MMESQALAVLPGIAHGFFTRQGGVSEGIYESLNCGYGAGDAAANVHENRRRVMTHLNAERLLTLYQIHSARAVAVTEPWKPGDAPQADAMVTDRSGMALGILTADCAPVLLADPEAGVVGAAHAGWKGALAGIIEETVGAMMDLGARAEAITAAIGPSLGPDSYEVDADFRDRFLATDRAFDAFFQTGQAPQKYFFDLFGFTRARLTAAGVQTIDVLGTDTYTDESRFFSYRRACHRGETDYGRQISAILLSAD
jgi:YfiH family protein